MVEDKGLATKKVIFKPLEDESVRIASNFPQLTLDDLYRIACGKYQIRNAISYYAQHTEHENEEIFQIYHFNCTPNPKKPETVLNFKDYGINVTTPQLLKISMDSRFRGNKSYKIFILVDNAKEGIDAIVEYYCTCPNGARTLGCCSHVMTPLWYMGYAHDKEIKVPNPDLCSIAF